MGREHEQLSLYQELSEAALRRYSRIRSRLVEGERKPYYLAQAVADVIGRSKRSPTEIFIALTKETGYTPARVDDGIGLGFDSWDKFFKEASEYMLWNKMYDDHQEIPLEEYRREVYWEGRRRNR